MQKAITNGKTDILKWYYFKNSTNMLNKNNYNCKTHVVELWSNQKPFVQ